MDVDWEGLALFVTAVGGATAMIVQAVKTASRVKAMQADVQGVRSTVHEIDKAVNGKAPGEQSMVAQVADVHKAVVDPADRGYGTP